MAPCNNHQLCINDALTNAKKVCIQHNARLTPLREQVLQLIWQNHKPLGAYDLINQLAQACAKPIAPPTIYRTLEFLLNLGLIHRINSLNAYIGCSSPSTQHPSHFLICRQCHNATECNHTAISREINQLSADTGFLVEQEWLEVIGLCNDCQE